MVEIRTYGGESETLAIQVPSGRLMAVNLEAQKRAQAEVNSYRDLRGEPVDVGYDSSTHLPEVGGGVWNNLPDLTRALQRANLAIHSALQEQGGALLSMSHHPFDEFGPAYEQGVLPKPIYDLLRGKRSESHIHDSVLSRIYPSEPQRGRGWKHEIGTMAASAQPWTSLEVDHAADQVAVLQATGWMFNLITANSPYVEGKATGKRDSRLEMWGPNGIMSTSRYDEDRKLTENLKEYPKGLTGYYQEVFGNERPMVVPVIEKTGDNGHYKTKFMAVVQPPDNVPFSALHYLKSDTVKAVNIETGEEEEVKPSVSHLINGFDFLYFPRYGARLRLNLPKGNEVDPKTFATAIEQGDEGLFQQLLEQGGISDGGFICAEGRVAATILPTKEHPDWKRFNAPFVLQTALVRSYDTVLKMLSDSGLSWQELTRDLPEQTNKVDAGFKTHIRGVSAADLAQKIWEVAKKSLTAEEQELAGNEIDSILSTKKAPAEEQMEFVAQALEAGSPLAVALLGLVNRETMVNTNIN